MSYIVQESVPAPLTQNKTVNDPMQDGWGDSILAPQR